MPSRQSERVRILRHLSILQNRAAHLARRIQSAAAEGKDLSFDKAELAALSWAVVELRKIHQSTLTS